MSQSAKKSWGSPDRHSPSWIAAPGTVDQVRLQIATPMTKESPGNTKQYSTVAIQQEQSVGQEHFVWVHSIVSVLQWFLAKPTGITIINSKKIQECMASDSIFLVNQDIFPSLAAKIIGKELCQSLLASAPSGPGLDATVALEPWQHDFAPSDS